MKAISRAKIAQNACTLMEEAQKQYGVFKSGFSITDADIEAPIGEFMNTIRLLTLMYRWVAYGRYWFDETGDCKKGLACIREGIQYKEKIEAVIASKKLAMIDGYLKQKVMEITSEFESMEKDNKNIYFA